MFYKMPLRTKDSKAKTIPSEIKSHFHARDAKGTDYLFSWEQMAEAITKALKHEEELPIENYRQPDVGARFFNGMIFGVTITWITVAVATFLRV